MPDGGGPLKSWVGVWFSGEESAGIEGPSALPTLDQSRWVSGFPASWSIQPYYTHFFPPHQLITNFSATLLLPVSGFQRNPEQ